MDALSLVITDGRDIPERYLQAPRIFRDEFKVGIDRITTQGSAYAIDELEENESVVTGNLRRSIFPNPAKEAGGMIVGEYGPHGVDYARIVEEGRGPVHARPGKVLAFRPRMAGPVFKGSPTLRSHHSTSHNAEGGRNPGWVFVKSVGPAAPKPYMRPSLQRVRPQAHKEFDAVITRILNRLRGAT